MKMLAVVPLFIVALCFMGCASGACPGGWLQFQAYCYRVYSNGQNGHAAKQYCRSLGHGVELVKINSVEENEFVLQLVRKKAPWATSVWIGLLWNTNTQSWAWSDDSKPFFTNWWQNEPNGNANEPCGEMRTKIANYNLNGGWNDLRCHHKKGFVCKMLAF
ncbi:perlucin-like protein [Oculina patagonica]